MRKYLLIGMLCLCGCFGAYAQGYSQYVDPFIGTSATGHTFPGATVPFGMVQLSPETGNFGWNYCSGYRYEDTVITGFAHTHLSGTGGVDLGDVLFFPFQGKDPQLFVSRFSHRKEKATPGYYEVILDNHDIKVQLTASAHTGLHRYTFNKAGQSHLLIDMQSGLVENAEELKEHVSEGSITVDSKASVSGYAFSSQWVEKKVYFTARFSKAFTGSHFIDEDHRRLIVDFDTQPGETIEAKVAISGVSIDGARKNLAAETANKTFDQVKAEAAKVWENYFNRMKAEGTTAQKTAFYTSIYHALIQPNNIADVDGQYRGADGEVHQSADKVYYSTLSLWDTYRAAQPFYTLMCPDKDGQIIETMLQHFNTAKLLPIWTLWGKESYAMIGNHAVPAIVDAALKGIKGFNREQAFAAIKASLTNNKSPKYNWDTYMRYGYLPSDSVKREAVSRTLEAAYDDWCAAQLAKSLHKTADYNYFSKRAHFYNNLFDKSTNLMRGRLANGEWVRPFAKLDSGQLAIGGDYTEGNAWQYVWSVQQDIPGLIKLMGGRKPFIAKLDSLFSMSSKVFGKGSTLDVTGLIGQYAHGNEPNHHVAYLYTLAGQPYKTQRLVRQITDQFYQNKPDGLSGNDDCGQMSAWYIFTAMGFYPVNPVDGRYVFGAPQLSRVSMALANGKSFVIEAKGLSEANKYVQSISLNGMSYLKNYISHTDILKGGRLIFVMGDKPRV
ncbi:alpha-1,2-mannosidase, putative [Mucilaginibacter lappiensis]|uniref:Alpha-1,2-mannosidase n=1 Tax=Mucilaginibacter lappiensis TaxID=354630 RepID=A0ABR6PH00_9SPHI|nr:GH92 family glycosyl hydrolase [Mucilaginibacter lappiensis]MBB6109039.1 putative alpha-1,2-mannosidase [Mucilaginibacter lappiensis]SIQ73106.1 alpha-1,2-mannosidase, putative [Mucilaginibacter lappiensis]